jgi:hypothetical protein
MRMSLACVLAFVVGCGSDKAPDKTADKPAAAPADALDLSGKWECIWNVPGGSGAETWMLIQDGTAVRVTLTGKDPGGRYTGSMTGTATGRDVALAFEYHDKTKGTMQLKASANGKILDGDSTRAKGGTVSHYGCSRP